MAVLTFRYTVKHFCSCTHLKSNSEKWWKTNLASINVHFDFFLNALTETSGIYNEIAAPAELKATRGKWTSTFFCVNLTDLYTCKQQMFPLCKAYHSDSISKICKLKTSLMGVFGWKVITSFPAKLDNMIRCSGLSLSRSIHPVCCCPILQIAGTLKEAWSRWIKLSL